MKLYKDISEMSCINIRSGKTHAIAEACKNLEGAVMVCHNSAHARQVRAQYGINAVGIDEIKNQRGLAGPGKKYIPDHYAFETLGERAYRDLTKLSKEIIDLKEEVRRKDAHINKLEKEIEKWDVLPKPKKEK